MQDFLSDFPGLQLTPPNKAVLLGSPLGEESMSDLLSAPLHPLKVIGDRLQHLHSHNAITLLRHSFAIPKVLHLLHMSPTFRSPLLVSWDNMLVSILSKITNIKFSPEDRAWIQATLPIRSGGLGIRRASFLAPSAFLASAVGASTLMQELLPPLLTNACYAH